MGFVFDRTDAMSITVITDALVEGHLGSALRTGEASQTVGVESQVQQDADINIAVQIITLLSGAVKDEVSFIFNCAITQGAARSACAHA